MEKYEPLHMRGTGTLDADTLSQCISMLFDHEPIEPQYGSRDWVYNPSPLLPSSMPISYTFVSGQDDFPLYISRRTMHWFRKHQAQGNREHRRKLIARRQKCAAFRRKKRGR